MARRPNPEGRPSARVFLTSRSARWSVRRFVALDLHGATGTNRRHRLVLFEFVVGTATMLVMGFVLLAHGGLLWGSWLLGCGLNYGALTAHALSLHQPHDVSVELEGVDITTEARRYSVAQMLLFIPGLVALVALVQARPYRGQR